MSHLVQVMALPEMSALLKTAMLTLLGTVEGKCRICLFIHQWTIEFTALLDFCNQVD